MNDFHNLAAAILDRIIGTNKEQALVDYFNNYKGTDYYLPHAITEIL